MIFSHKCTTKCHWINEEIVAQLNSQRINKKREEYKESNELARFLFLPLKFKPFSVLESEMSKNQTMHACTTIIIITITTCTLVYT